jgi:hypothetical protein
VGCDEEAGIGAVGAARHEAVVRGVVVSFLKVTKGLR